MTLSDGANIAVIAQGVLVVVSLILVVFQLRQNGKLAKAANAQHLTEQAASFNAHLYSNSELASLWYSFGEFDDAVSRVDRLRYREMLVQWMIMHENIFLQWRAGLLEPELYEAWRHDLESTIECHDLSVMAEDVLTIFPGQFGQAVLEHERKISKAKKS